MPFDFQIKCIQPFMVVWSAKRVLYLLYAYKIDDRFFSAHQESFIWCTETINNVSKWILWVTRDVFLPFFRKHRSKKQLTRFFSNIPNSFREFSPRWSIWRIKTYLNYTTDPVPIRYESICNKIRFLKKSRPFLFSNTRLWILFAYQQVNR